MHHVLESSVGTGLVFILVSCDALCAAKPRTDVAGSGPGVRHRGSHGHDQAVQASILARIYHTVNRLRRFQSSCNHVIMSSCHHVIIPSFSTLPGKD